MTKYIYIAVRFFSLFDNIRFHWEVWVAFTKMSDLNIYNNGFSELFLASWTANEICFAYFCQSDSWCLGNLSIFVAKLDSLVEIPLGSRHFLTENVNTFVRTSVHESKVHVVSCAQLLSYNVTFTKKNSYFLRKIKYDKRHCRWWRNVLNITFLQQQIDYCTNAIR